MMKNWARIILILTLATMASCTKDKVSSTKIEKEFFAYLEEGKTSLQQDGKIYWVPGDEIAVFSKTTGAKGKFTTYNLSEESPKTQFKGYLEYIYGSMDENPGLPEFFAVYPYSDEVIMDADTLVIPIASEQIAKANNFGQGSHYSVSRTNNDIFTFKNVCGGICFQVYNSGIKQIELTASGEKVLAGDARVYLDEEKTPIIKRIVNGKSTIHLTCPEGEEFIPGKKYHMTIPPVALDSAFCIKFYKQDSVAEYSSDSTLVINRSEYKLAKEIDKNLKFKITVTEINLEETELSLRIGEEKIIQAAVLPETASNKKLIWQSSNNDVAEVDSTGKVTGKAEGQCYIEVISEDNPNVTAICIIEVASTIDLSKEGTANCYLVTKPGDYKFSPQVKGKSKVGLEKAESVKLLWESNNSTTAPKEGSIISSPRLIDGYVNFSIPDPMVEGNAVIAVLNSNDKIIWSWHIWVCAGYDPEKEALDCKNVSYKMMDRNIGALSSTPGDYRSIGLMYQWGRKDPFLGGGVYKTVKQAVSTGVWSKITSSETVGTIDYAVANPMCFIIKLKNQDWLYSSSSITDNTRWGQKIDLYDPCPKGWTVPNGGANGFWCSACGTSESFKKTFESSRAVNMKGTITDENTDCWFQSNGELTDSEGKLEVSNSMIHQWTTTSINNVCSIFQITYMGDVSPNISKTKATGLGVRCVKAK